MKKKIIASRVICDDGGVMFDYPRRKVRVSIPEWLHGATSFGEDTRLSAGRYLLGKYSGKKWGIAKIHSFWVNDYGRGYLAFDLEDPMEKETFGRIGE